jgi:hypothetical protein
MLSALLGSPCDATVEERISEAISEVSWCVPQRARLGSGAKHAAEAFARRAGEC